MSQQGKLSDVGDFETVTGNSGGPVPFDGSGNINIVGAAPVTVTGNPGTFTLTIADDGSIPLTFTEDTGTATTAANNINVLGDATQGSVTSGAGETITITNSSATTSQLGVVELSTDAESIAGTSSTVAVVPSTLAAKLGVQTVNGIAFGGTIAGAVGWTGPLSDGQLIIGDSGATPKVGNLTSTGGSITVTEGAGTLNVDVAPGGGGGAWTWVESQTASNDATLDFVNLDSTSRYMVVYDSVQPVTSGAELYMRVSIDNGSTFETTGYLSTVSDFKAASGTDSTTEIRLTSQGSTNTDEYNGVLGSMVFSRMGVDENRCHFLGSSTFGSTIGASVGCDCFGLGPDLGATDAVDALQIYYSTGNILAGSVHIYSQVTS